jgi:hemolysin III
MRPADLGKPRLRGWLHAIGFFVALLGGVVLTVVAAASLHRPGPGGVISVAIYSLSLCGLLGTSALYHRRVWSPRGYQVMRRLDHSMIFVLIAGTYTPFAVLLLPRTEAAVILAVIWGGGGLGVAMALAWPHARRWLSAPIYVALGWVAVAILPDLFHRGGAAAVVLLVLGGLVYTFGALSYALRRPNPWPRTFGHHEVFHAATLVAALLHFVAVCLAVHAAS